MYAGIDVGGTKTLAAVLDDHGVILEQVKFPTPADYDEFLSELRQAFDGFKHDDFHAAGIGVPATVLDREHGYGISFGNLPWRNVPLCADVERILRCPVALENDAKMAGLSEAMLLKKYHKILYVTVSTGIGFSLIVDRQIDTSFGDGGGRAMILDHRGKHMPWESFASGKAIFEKYGKPAHDITDEAAWRHIAANIAQGLIELIAFAEPDVIVFGGSVGTYFDRYKKQLQTALKSYEMPLVPIPPLRAAQRPEEAVVYGCYDLAKAKFANAHAEVRP